MRRAVITGVGVVSAFGVGADTFFRALAEGRSAVGPIRHFDASAFAVRVAGEVPVLDASAAWLEAELRPLDVRAECIEYWREAGFLRDRKVGFGVLAAAEAWASAHAGDTERDAWLSIGLGMEEVFLDDIVPVLGGPAPDWSQAATAHLPRTRFRSRADECARRVAELLGLRGPLAVHASACASGAFAVAHAAALIERAAADVVLAGAADSMVNPMSLGGLMRLGAPSPRNEADACRPFDRRRDGMAVGEGAAMFVVELEERARSRGVRPLAAILGAGSTQDAYRLSAPRPDGSAASAAVGRALRRAKLPADAIDYVNAHGTGTLLNDPAEARALRGALGRRAETVPVSSIKGAVGHLMAASGAIELAACLLPLTRKIIPATAHHRELDAECNLHVIGEVPWPCDAVEVTLSTSFGFGGQNGAVILGRCP